MASSGRMQREKRQQEYLSADGDFFLPINQRSDDPLETSGIDITTVDTAIAAENKGYQMLQKMGWGGKGLGRKENGVPITLYTYPLSMPYRRKGCQSCFQAYYLCHALTHRHPIEWV